MRRLGQAELICLHIPIPDLLRELQDIFEVVGLAAGGNIDLLAKQVKQHKPQIVSVRDSAGLARLRDALSGWSGPMPKIVCGEEVSRGLQYLLQQGTCSRLRFAHTRTIFDL